MGKEWTDGQNGQKTDGRGKNNNNLNGRKEKKKKM